MAIIKLDGYVIGTERIEEINIRELEENGFVVVIK